ncbi:putative ATP synthase delta chain [Liberibacter crescens BT-1]|uniref:ATP synthase subunit delta n=1 Tax=Liberibacter crescens (strain BT-1) TaxID=1215343 RepID=L0EW37_LIBCB|nr:ATP synthase F1 subunit delta [Liberibacter crescens]AGA65172.1 putative ATP synthase delta chain [Liberibacter crescens BT-1]AMC13130.1 hypothetical protein RL73_05970 [Liberibacter crescens]
MIDLYRLFPGLIGRYAHSLFSVASEEGLIDSVSNDVLYFAQIFSENADFKMFLESPVFSVKEKIDIVDAFVKKAGFCEISINFFKLLIKNNRLLCVKQVIEAFNMICSYYRGEIIADVKVADVLSIEEKNEFRVCLREIFGQEVLLNIIVDPSLIAGFIVKVRSRQIDVSLRAKFSNIGLILKEVG